MSHDIRTPMNAIVGMSTIGQLKLDDRRSVQDCFCKIDASSRYLLSLINDILDMSKIETGKMELAHEYFDFTELMDEVNQIIYPQAEERQIEYVIYHSEPLEQFYIGDPLRLKQILMNLLSNALKFTRAGGRIQIQIEEQKRTNGFSYLRFQVKDTGIGMSREFRSRLFMPFEQEAPETARNNIGSGLGLSIVYNLVQLMGGSIEVESEKEKGSDLRSHCLLNWRRMTRRWSARERSGSCFRAWPCWWWMTTRWWAARPHPYLRRPGPNPSGWIPVSGLWRRCSVCWKRTGITILP